MTSIRRLRELTRTAAVAMFDAFAMYQAFILAFAVRASDSKPLAHHMSFSAFAELTAAYSPLWIAIFAGNGLYSARADRGRAREAGRVALGVAGGVMGLIVTDYLHGTIFPSRAVPVYALVFGICFVIACRALVRAGCVALFERGVGVSAVVLIGTGPQALQLARAITTPGRGARLVGSVSGRFAGVPSFDSLDDALASLPRVDEVLQVDVLSDRDEVTRTMALANARGISYRFVPDQYGIYAAASTMTTVNGVPVMEVRLTSLDGWGAVGKRVFDLAGALALSFVVSPVVLALAAISKVREPAAPVFYRHTRLGQGGRRIELLKFRSMRWEYCTGPQRPYASAEEAFLAMGRADLIPEFRRNQKVADDPRVDWFGRFVRSTSLDELPQLWNAVRGDLSLVGPRPITPGELSRYGSQTASLLALKPGITGLWQVSGRSQTAYDERVKLDVSYIENWSPLLDVTILARTFPVVLGRRGAV